jgi:signal transduction histidine kinase
MSVGSWLMPRRDDALLAAAVVVVSQIEVWVYGVAGGSWQAAVTLGLAAAAMLYRGRHPVLTVAVIALGLCLCAEYAGEPFSVTSVVTFLTAMFSVGAMPQRRTALVTLVLALVLSAFAVEPWTLNNYLGISLSSIGVPWLLGALWLRRKIAREAERRQREAAEQAVAAERIRLAQDLHDVVSHNVGMIAVQAGAADVTLDKDADATRESLRAIEAGARDTLMELRQLLGLLRDDDPDPRTTRPTIAALPDLFAPLDQAGVEISWEATGVPTAVSGEVELTAFRIVQEALTNVVKHAGPCRVSITLRHSAEALRVEVADNGRACSSAAQGEGFGLTGIRERVSALGGTVTAGPRIGGGFVVDALLPLAAT